MRTVTTAGRAAGLLAAAVLLASCTVGTEQPDEEATDAAPPVSAQPEEPEASPSPEGPSPQELNDEVLAAAAAAAAQEPVAGATGVAASEQVETVLDVLEVRAVEDATLVRMRLSAPSGQFTAGPTTFADGRFGTQNFVRELYLDDAAAGTRYLPLQFEDYRTACVCPYLPLVVGPEPQEVHALFPPLPPGTAVDLTLAASDIVVTGLTVEG